MSTQDKLTCLHLVEEVVEESQVPLPLQVIHSAIACVQSPSKTSSSSTAVGRFLPVVSAGEQEPLRSAVTASFPATKAVHAAFHQSDVPVRVVGQLPSTGAVPSIVPVVVPRAVRPPGLAVRIVRELPSTSTVPSVVPEAVPRAIRSPGLAVRVVKQLSSTSAVPSVVSVAGQCAQISQQSIPVRAVGQLKLTDAVSSVVSNACDGNHHRSTSVAALSLVSLPGVHAPIRSSDEQHGQQPSTRTVTPSLVPVADVPTQESGIKIGRQKASTGSAVPSIASLADVNIPKNQHGMMTAVVRQKLPISASASVIPAGGGSVCVVSRTPAKMISVQKPLTRTVPELCFTSVPSQIRPPGKIINVSNQKPSTSAGTSDITTDRATDPVMINLPENITRDSDQKPSTSVATFYECCYVRTYEPVLPSSPIMMITDEHQAATGTNQPVVSTTCTEHSESCCLRCRMLLMKIEARSAQIMVALCEQSAILNRMKGIRRNARSLAMEIIGNQQQFDAFQANIDEDDCAFYSLTQRLDAEINSQNANNRMHEALDVLFEGIFLAHCS